MSDQTQIINEEVVTLSSGLKILVVTISVKDSENVITVKQVQTITIDQLNSQASALQSQLNMINARIVKFA